MRRAVILAFLLGFAAAHSSIADAPTRQRLVRYFGGWYSFLPGSRVSAVETQEVVLAGFEAYRVERHSGSKVHQESNVAFYDRGRDEVFVGDVFHDPDRAAAKRPFDPAKDLPNIQASLREAFGRPVRVTLGQASRGVLQSLTVAIEQRRDAFATESGFVSTDGATLMLGEFHPLAESPAAFRQRLLGESRGIRPERPGSFTVVEFVDFQCERCKKRSPEIRRAAEELGGSVEVRLLPLVKMHDWAFAAAECATALSAAAPKLFSRYEEEVFARQEKMTAAEAEELAADLAESVKATEKYQAELSNGRARDRVLADITLAIRLGISGTPSFLEDGNFISGERDLLETYLAEKFPASPGRASRARIQ